MPAISISLSDVRKKMGPNQALAGISDEFQAATLHGIIGPDGAGKTTLLRCLVGLLKPDEGGILFSQDQALVPFAEVRPLLAYMPQQQSLYPDLSVSEHLDFFRELYQIAKPLYEERRASLLHLARLAEFKDRPAGQLSGGMYKKLGLICALLQSPRMMFLDEPTNGVDPISRREFWELLYRLLGQGILILVTTAYMDEAERCGRVHLMDGGRLLASGEPRAVLEKEGVEKFEDIFLKIARQAHERR
jgi:ABC-2 type transport system ATP-binding protein